MTRGWLVAGFAVAGLALAPVAGLAGLAAHGSGELWPHLWSFVLPQAARETATLLLGVGIVVSVVGVGTAWTVAAFRFPGRGLFEWALLLPLAMPAYVAAFAYADLLHPLGPAQSGLRWLLGYASPRDLRLPDIRSMGGCILLLGATLYPYVYLTARATFAMQSAAVLEVPRTLGAGPWRTFFTVALPLARPAIAVGAALALMEALNDVGAAEFLGVRTLTVSVYTTWVNRSSVEGAAQIALMMLGLVIALVALERWARRRQATMSSARQARRAAPRDPGPLGRALCVAVCAAPILVGFVAPALHLANEAAARVAAFGFPAQIVAEAANSFAFAGLATVIAVAFGFTAAYAARLCGKPAKLALRTAGVGYAMPGVVVAVGLLTPLAAFDNMVDGWSRELFGVSTGLLISGSGAALIYAYVVRFLAIPAGAIEAGLGKIPRSLDDTARSLGERPFGVALRIHAPLAAPAIGAAALLVFVDCMKELPATLLLRPLNFETLATHVYGEAARGSYESGAVAALAIVAVGLLPVVLIAKASGKASERAVLEAAAAPPTGGFATPA
ncbi:MAG: iron ABC transporter permease [Ancylobacter novellus]|uniref:Iron ABC transporter permease n=1 Tax=Ancylobacter novellus TaxID=921 RepID=A0A2W5K6N8_ANCNO|nr:MAG: iron ABC transporter permease [Ancylobacter novellus]